MLSDYYYEPWPWGVELVVKEAPAQGCLHSTDNPCYQKESYCTNCGELLARWQCGNSAGVLADRERGCRRCRVTR